MIYVIIGTKGQFMKMFPIMKLLDNQHVPYKFVHTCQHYGIIEKNRKRLGVRKPNVMLTRKKKDLANIWEFLWWAPQVIWNARKLPIKQTDLVVIHGDAESTLLGFIIGKMFRAKIVHVEAGARSGNFWEPFPEEFIRFFVSKLSNYCFCPYQKDANNLLGKPGVFVTNGNTVFDSVRYALTRAPSPYVRSFMRKKNYVLFLIHRKENLFSSSRAEAIVDILEMILKGGFTVFWPMHTNTVFELRKKRLWNRIKNLQRQYSLQTQYFFDYVDFMHAVKESEFVASDGGGLQKETYILNVPMLILRKVTEVEPGVGETAILSELDTRKVTAFLKQYKNYRHKKRFTSSPSKIVVDTLRRLG